MRSAPFLSSAPSAPFTSCCSSLAAAPHELGQDAEAAAVTEAQHDVLGASAAAVPAGTKRDGISRSSWKASSGTEGVAELSRRGDPPASLIGEPGSAVAACAGGSGFTPAIVQGRRRRDLAELLAICYTFCVGLKQLRQQQKQQQ